MRNQKGFALILFLILAPLFSLLLLGLGMIFRGLDEWKVRQHDCRSSLLTIQGIAGETTHALLKLNIPVRHLHQEYRSARKIISTPQGQAWMKTILVRQQILKLRQEALVRIALARMQEQHLRLLRRNSGLGARPRLELKRGRAQPIVSEFHVPPNFSDRQNLAVRWRVNLWAVWDSQLESLRAHWGFSPVLRGNCGATLRMERHSWVPALSADRP